MKTLLKMRRRDCGILGFFFALGAVFIFTSCLTGLLPGENGRILRNLAKEYYDIAQTYAAQNQYDKAISFYQLAARNFEFRKPARYQIARMNAMAGKWAEAETAYRALLRSDRNNMDLRSSLAYVLAQGVKLDEAEAMYAALVTENPFNEALMENYIRVLMARKKGEQASAELEHFIERFPQSASAESLTTAMKALAVTSTPVPEP